MTNSQPPAWPSKRDSEDEVVEGAVDEPWEVEEREGRGTRGGRGASVRVAELEKEVTGIATVEHPSLCSS